MTITDKYTQYVPTGRTFGAVLGAVQGSQGDAFGTHPIGTGPFKFVRWEPGKEIVVVANPDYFDGPPRLSRVVYRIFRGEEFDAMYDQFQRGKPGPIRRRAPVPDVHEPLRHRGPQLCQLPGQHDPAVIDDHHVLAQVLDQVQLVAGEQHRHAPGRHIGKQPAHGIHGDRVQAGKRLIEHQQVRVADQRGDQLNPLLVAVRQRIQPVRRPPGQVEPL